MLIGDGLTFPDLRGALCAETDPEAFFPEKGATGRPAKQVCAGWSVREACLQWALDTRQPFGVWGGLSERERRQRLERRERPPVQCGTLRGYSRHRRRGEPICEPCRQANADTCARRRRAAA